MIRDVVQRVKCELSEAFDEKTKQPEFLWLESWTTHVDPTLTINDNAGISLSESFTAQPRVAHAPAKPNTIRTMFRNYRGDALISSSSPNEDSFYPNKSAGSFTRQLIDALNNLPAVQPQFIWNQVIAKATVPIDVPHFDRCATF